jgi:hypothetical protein
MRLPATRQKPISFDEVNNAALACPPAVLRRLLPGGKIVNAEYVVRNPTRDDRSPGSFKINMRSGRWSDFSTGDKGGDPVSLVSYIEHIPQHQAARLLAGLLGIGAR